MIKRIGRSGRYSNGKSKRKSKRNSNSITGDNIIVLRDEDAGYCLHSLEAVCQIPRWSHVSSGQGIHSLTEKDRDKLDT